MNEDEIRAAVVDELCRVASDLDPDEVAGDAHLLDDLGLDSMDVLNLVTALAKRFGITIPEVDYRQLETPDQAVAYILRKTG
jgi:acyl carrier protein